MKKVSYFSERLNDGTLQTPRQMLDAAIESLPGHYNKAVLVLLNDDEGEYDVGFYQSGMRMNEILALLRVSEQIFLGEMGYGL